MSSGKDLLHQFKAAAWKAPEEIEAFVASIETPEPPEVLKLLDIVSGKAPDANVHRLRLTVFARIIDKNPDKSLFVPFVKALKGAEPGLRTTLASLLPKVNSATEHAALVEHLRSPDAGLRATVARTLTQIGGGKTIFEMLTRAVGEPNFAGRTEALDVLVVFAKHQAVPALQAAIAAGSPAEKVHALKHLGDPKVMGKDPAAALKVIAPVLDAQQQPEPVVIQGILSFSALCAEQDWFEYVGIFLDADLIGMTKAAVDGLRRFASARVIAALERKLRAGPRAIRLAVLNALEAIGTDAVLPPLVDALAHKQIPVRNRAAEVLKHLSMEGKLDLSRTVVWLLRSRDVNVRRMATEVIRAVPDPDQSLWPKLMGVLRDEDWWVRERVMDALIELGGTQLTPHMVPLLGDKSDVIRRFAVNVLGRLKDPKALRSLVQTATQDPDWWVKETAIEAVALINDARAVPYIVHIMGADADLHTGLHPGADGHGRKGSGAASRRPLQLGEPRRPVPRRQVPRQVRRRRPRGGGGEAPRRSSSQGAHRGARADHPLADHRAGQRRAGGAAARPALGPAREPGGRRPDRRVGQAGLHEEGRPHHHADAGAARRGAGEGAPDAAPDHRAAGVAAGAAGRRLLARGEVRGTALPRQRLQPAGRPLRRVPAHQRDSCRSSRSWACRRWCSRSAA